MRSKSMMLGLAALIGLGFYLRQTQVALRVEDEVFANQEIEIYSAQKKELIPVMKIIKSDDEWKSMLPLLSYQVLRHQATERAFTHDEIKGKGIYQCAGCGTDLYLSSDKFDSGTGWPSFTKPISESNVGYAADRKLFYERTEVHCARCGGHLGHVFDDGPAPTFKRHCINGAALQFVPESSDE